MMRKCTHCLQLLPTQSFPRAHSLGRKGKTSRCLSCSEGKKGEEKQLRFPTHLGLIYCSLVRNATSPLASLVHFHSLLRLIQELPLLYLPDWVFGGILVWLWGLGGQFGKQCNKCTHCHKVSVLFTTFGSDGCIDCWLTWLIDRERDSPQIIYECIQAALFHITCFRTLKSSVQLAQGPRWL